MSKRLLYVSDYQNADCLSAGPAFPSQARFAQIGLAISPCSARRGLSLTVLPQEPVLAQCGSRDMIIRYKGNGFFLKRKTDVKECLRLRTGFATKHNVCHLKKTRSVNRWIVSDCKDSWDNCRFAGANCRIAAAFCKTRT